MATEYAPCLAEAAPKCLSLFVILCLSESLCGVDSGWPCLVRGYSTGLQTCNVLPCIRGWHGQSGLGCLSMPKSGAMLTEFGPNFARMGHSPDATRWSLLKTPSRLTSALAKVLSFHSSMTVSTEPKPHSATLVPIAADQIWVRFRPIWATFEHNLGPFEQICNHLGKTGGCSGGRCPPIWGHLDKIRACLDQNWAVFDQAIWTEVGPESMRNSSV